MWLMIAAAENIDFHEVTSTHGDQTICHPTSGTGFLHCTAILPIASLSQERVPAATVEKVSTGRAAEVEGGQRSNAHETNSGSHCSRKPDAERLARRSHHRRRMSCLPGHKTNLRANAPAELYCKAAAHFQQHSTIPCQGASIPAHGCHQNQCPKLHPIS